MSKLCSNIIEVKGRKVCKFDYAQNPFTYRKKMWGECTDNYKHCYTYLRGKEIDSSLDAKDLKSVGVK